MTRTYRFLPPSVRDASDHATAALSTSHHSPPKYIIVGLTILLYSEVRNDRLGYTPTQMPIYHIVLVKFNKDSTAKQLQEWRDAAAALPSKIPSVQKLITGDKVPGNQFGGDWDDCLIYIIDNRSDLPAYAVHEAHQAYLKVAATVVQGDAYVLLYRVSSVTDTTAMGKDRQIFDLEVQ
ncbi:hypothetical protein DENSPDRAFT_879198 [Dentipellis sp. KUC8613]|nr:hypothetical protein DENSPDRAFT_879198 [Dentipellis sp. KUC8613]